MEIIKIPVGIYAANCYIVYCKDTKEGIVIDPGSQGAEIGDKIKDLGLSIKYIILTHGHWDHTDGILGLKEKIDVPVLIHKEDEPLLRAGKKGIYSKASSEGIEVAPDKYIEDGDKLKVGDMTIEIIHTPGHSPGGVSIKIGDRIFTGDTLFTGSIGRTDLYGGSYETLLSSIKEKLLIYPDNTIVYPGHGESSTIGREKVTNPFIK
ncbi:MAG TPA: MBL fold metallo-hydrolase [Tissierellales bacterium]|nr:MBL fold metallo-hydrolase [Tissierellales bacterium]